MNAPGRPKLVLAAAIPAELRGVLERDYELVARGALQPDGVAGLRVAVTTSIAGADARLMDFLPDLRLIACNGAGLENIDLAEARRRGIAVCNTPDAVTADTADFAVGLIYAVSRRIVAADRFVRSGAWGREKMSPSTRVGGKRLGIVGLGKIGHAIAQRGAALGMQVAYTATSAKRDVPFEYVATVAQLAAVSDVLVLAVPGGEATRNLVSHDVLERLGGKGILINISRGSVVDEPALIAALRAGAIAGAGLDVFASEPEVDAQLLSCENVVLSPHYASVTNETRAAIAEDLRTNIESFFTGGAVRDAAAAVLRCQ